MSSPPTQVSGAATVMLPACEPLVPVVIVTFAAPSAVCSVATLMMLSLVLASKLPPVLLASLEIMTLYGSSSSVPNCAVGRREVGEAGVIELRLARNLGVAAIAARGAAARR